MNVVQLQQPEQEATFDDFWILYPRREAKKAASKSWGRMSAAQQMDALIALIDWRRVFLARESVQYIPLPASWLNGERWEDEVPVEFRRRDHQDMAAASKAKVGEEMATRTPMPDALRRLLASLKK